MLPLAVPIGARSRQISSRAGWCNSNVGSIGWASDVGIPVQIPPTDIQYETEPDGASHGFGPVMPWLLRQKVMPPDSVERFVERSTLARQCDPIRRQITVINAPGGFGKTTVLAEACRGLRQRGVVVAWLSIDEEDGPDALAAYLVFAFSEAGLDILDSPATSEDLARTNYRINLLIHSIEAHGADCVLALDDVHRLRTPAALAVVDRLLRHGPPNLHLALACRGLPGGLDVATSILQGRGITVTAEELRFEKRDIARFFDTTLSRAELAELTETSGGWPIALCIHRNVRGQDASGNLAQEIALNWIQTRLWRSLSGDDQDFVLDVGLFEWIETELVDEVLGAGSARRIQSVSALSGLLRSVGGKTGTMLLHPLVRDYCTDERYRETPDRYRSIHRAIAVALGRQGHLLAGMRHATEAGDPRLVGEILEDAGGFRVWLKHGLTRLRQVNEMLKADVLAGAPRLGLVRCMELTMRGEFEAALSAYVEIGARTDGFTRTRDGGKDRELALDHVAFRFVMATCGCRPIASPETRALVSEMDELANNREIDPLLRGSAQFAMCRFESQRANLDAALEWARRASAELAGESSYVTMHVDFMIGNIAMLQGRTGDAAKAYSRAGRAAKSDLLEDAGSSVIADILVTELGLERSGKVPHGRRSHNVPMLARSGAWLDVYVAASEAAMELAVQQDDPNEALEELGEVVAFAQGIGLSTLWRCLAAMRASLLVGADRTEDAERSWASAELPRRVIEIVDLKNQTWREMEAVACARLRLLTAQRQFGAARKLAEALLATSRERGLRRTEMRGLASAMVLEHRAGNAAAACGRLVEYLEIYAETDYARPLVHEREISLDLLERLCRENRKGSLGTLASSLIRALGNVPSERNIDFPPVFTPREYDILQRLDRWRDKEIANALSLSEDGVRYHNKKIYNKLGVRTRFEATRRARSMGILPALDGEATAPRTTERAD